MQMETQQASIRILENQLKQLASALSNSPPGRLPSDAQVSRMEEAKQCKAVELRSGKELLDRYKNKKSDAIEEKGGPFREEENKDGWVEV